MTQQEGDLCVIQTKGGFQCYSAGSVHTVPLGHFYVQCIFLFPLLALYGFYCLLCAKPVEHDHIPKCVITRF